MKINAKTKLENTIFYNNLCVIMVIFCIASFLTSYNLEYKSIASKNYYNLTEGAIYGPIKVKKGQSKICTIKAIFYGSNTSTYLTGEVLDKDKETLYEFGKDFWHEDGYDSEGYWSEADRKMKADLTFNQEGEYYIQFGTENNGIYNISIQLNVKKGSGIPHFCMGMVVLIILIFIFYIYNKEWIKNTLVTVDEWLEDTFND